MNLQSHNPLIESITKIYENRDKLLKCTERLLEIETEIVKIEQFLEIERNIALLLSVMICEQLTNEAISIRKLLKNMGFGTLEIIQSQDWIKRLKRKGWIKLSNRRYNAIKMDEYEVTKMLLDGITYNDKSKLKRKKPDTLAEAIIYMKQVITESIGEFDIYDTIHTVINVMDEFIEYPFFFEIVNNKGLIDLEKVLLTWMAFDVIKGNEEFDINIILDNFLDDPSYAFWFKQRIYKGESHLIKDNYIEFNKPNFIDFTGVILGNSTYNLLTDLNHSNVQKRRRTTFCKVIEYDRIPEEILYFNSHLEHDILNIKRTLENVQYEKLMKRFKENNMNECLTILFHGSPGTGKTELVKQFARITKRVIYQIDISSIKDMWVGQSEKNLKKVFKEYQEAIKQEEIIPILLFNEADAIIGKRTMVQNSVDQMNNSMQNILLQELEDMKGIFIATTNLINNIDSAFERRFLYKLKFDLPDQHTRYNILRNQFQMEKDDLLKEIANKFDLSGGQISNIKRKIIADKLLNDKYKLNETLFKKYIKSEMMFRIEKSKIGFNIT